MRCIFGVATQRSLARQRGPNCEAVRLSGFKQRDVRHDNHPRRRRGSAQGCTHGSTQFGELGGLRRDDYRHLPPPLVIDGDDNRISDE